MESGYHFAPKGECGVDGQATGTFPSEALGYPSGARWISTARSTRSRWSGTKTRCGISWTGRSPNELTRFHVPIIPRWPFYLILNTAVSPFGLPEALECGRDLYHYVDYVRVYQRATKTVDDKVWAFLFAATVWCLAALGIAACCAMRPAGDEDEDSSHAFALGGLGGVDHERGARRFSRRTASTARASKYRGGSRGTARRDGRRAGRT